MAALRVSVRTRRSHHPSPESPHLSSTPSMHPTPNKPLEGTTSTPSTQLPSTAAPNPSKSGPRYYQSSKGGQQQLMPDLQKQLQQLQQQLQQRMKRPQRPTAAAVTITMPGTAPVLSANPYTFSNVPSGQGTSNATQAPSSAVGTSIQSSSSTPTVYPCTNVAQTSATPGQTVYPDQSSRRNSMPVAVYGSLQQLQNMQLMQQSQFQSQFSLLENYPTTNINPIPSVPNYPDPASSSVSLVISSTPSNQQNSVVPGTQHSHPPPSYTHANSASYSLASALSSNVTNTPVDASLDPPLQGDPSNQGIVLQSNNNLPLSTLTSSSQDVRFKVLPTCLSLPTMSSTGVESEESQPQLPLPPSAEQVPPTTSAPATVGDDQGSSGQAHPQGTAAAGTKQEKKKPRKKKTVDKIPRLLVLNVQETMVECQLETTTQQTKFRFDITGDEPQDVTNKLVGLHHYLMLN